MRVNTHHDPSLPGGAHAPGYWADRAWMSIPLAERTQLQGDTALRTPASRHPIYTPTDLCTSCGLTQAHLKGLCRRCYQRAYMRHYYASHPHQH